MKVFHFSVDDEHAKQHNEFLSNTRYFFASAIILGVITMLVGLIVYFGPGNQAVWALMVLIVAILLGIAFIAAGITTKRRSGGAQEMYDRYPLVPAVISDSNDRDAGLLALVNTNVDPKLPPRWGLAYTRIKALPGMDKPLTVGTKVPAVAVFGQRATKAQEFWQTIRPMPIAWGTPDEDVIATARKAIPNDQWNKLDNGRRKLDEVRASRDQMILL